MLKNYLLALIPLFVAVNAIGVLPIFVSLTEGVDKKEKSRIIIQSMFTASALAISFILVGKVIFKLLGITVADFMIAGGATLFCIAITDVINPAKKRHIPIGELGAVPLGTPLIVGPAVLTTSLVIIPHYGMPAVISSVLLNIVFAGLVLRLSSSLMLFLGETGAKALSKVISLLLAAIAVMLIRKGFEQMLLSPTG